eukprot:gene24198-biopygen19400
MTFGVSRDIRWEARLLPEAIRIICAPGARACGGPDRGAKAGIPRSVAPTRDKMRKVRKLQKNTGFVRDSTTKMPKKYIYAFLVYTGGGGRAARICAPGCAPENPENPRPPHRTAPPICPSTGPRRPKAPEIAGSPGVSQSPDTRKGSCSLCPPLREHAGGGGGQELARFRDFSDRKSDVVRTLRLPPKGKCTLATTGNVEMAPKAPERLNKLHTRSPDSPGCGPTGAPMDNVLCFGSGNVVEKRLRTRPTRWNLKKRTCPGRVLSCFSQDDDLVPCLGSGTTRAGNDWSVEQPGLGSWGSGTTSCSHPHHLQRGGIVNTVPQDPGSPKCIFLLF